MIQYCRSCGLFNPQQNICYLNKQSVNPNEDFCSKHMSNIAECDHCHTKVIRPYLIQDGDSWKQLCKTCLSKINTCIFCKIFPKCEFETNPDPMPKTIQKQAVIRNMVTVTTVDNPARVEKYCKTGCPCYDSENGCSRHFNYCQKYDCIYADPSSPKENQEIDKEEIK